MEKETIADNISETNMEKRTTGTKRGEKPTKTSEKKPFEIVIEELRNEINGIVSNALNEGMPTSVVELIISNLSLELNNIKKMQYESALQFYNNANK